MSELLNSLPTELLIRIFEFLLVPDCAMAMRVCKRWYELAEPCLWLPEARDFARGERLRNKYKEFRFLDWTRSKYSCTHAAALLWSLRHRTVEPLRSALRSGAVPEDFVCALIAPAITRGGGCAPVLAELLKHLPPRRKKRIMSPRMLQMAKSSTLEVYRVLLDYGEDPNQLCIGRRPVLFELHGPDTYERAQLMMRYGAVLTDRVGRLSVLDFAATHGREYLFWLLRDAGVDIYASTPDERYPNALACAAGSHRRDIVDMLLNGGVDPAERNAAGWSALTVAAARGRPYMLMDVLLPRSDVTVDANIRSGEGVWTPLMHAVHRGCYQLTHRLLDAGADVRIEDRPGRGALELAVAQRQWRNAAAIIKIGCQRSAADDSGGSVNADSKWRAPPWVMAVDTGSRAVVRRVVTKSAAFDIETRDNRGRTFLMRAAMLGGINDRTTAWYLGRAGVEDCEADSAVEAVDDDGHTTLYWTVHEATTVRLVRLLLRRGADPNRLSGPDGELPLGVAAERGSIYLLRLLVRTGGRVNALDGKNRTALSHAAAHPTRMQEMVQLLMAAGAQPSREMCDEDGLRPADWARQREQEEAFEDAVNSWREHYTEDLEKIETLLETKKKRKKSRRAM